jgi:non-canonical purine NTP pyrophosphatase (RdgB/HAM1 family)
LNNSKKLSIGKDLLIATGNRGKFQEISQIISSIPISCFPAYDFVEEEPDEDGNSFAENALLKAKYYARKTGLTALADDSGICIVDLNNKPGIHSARYAINDETKKRDFGFAFIKIQNELKSKNINPQSNPRAFFIGIMAFCNF